MRVNIPRVMKVANGPKVVSKCRGEAASWMQICHRSGGRIVPVPQITGVIWGPSARGWMEMRKSGIDLVDEARHATATR